MKILHVCLAAFYIDNYAYQENLLPRFHKYAGNEVRILASTETYVDNMTLGYVKPSEYVNSDGIQVTRLSYVSWLPHWVGKKLRIYPKVYEYIEEFKPDFIFIHDVQFLSIRQFCRYKKEHSNVKIAADGHADFLNSARGFVSKNILHGIIYRKAISKTIPYFERYYGTLPSREDFFSTVYHIPQDKIKFLPMGIDDEILESVEKENSREKIRNELGIKNDECVFITGGKIGYDKKDVLKVMDAINKCAFKVKLIVFGSVISELKDEFEEKQKAKKVIYLGWADEKRSYELLVAADIAIFPCLHSTLWEQSAGVGLPCILHKMEGFSHININDNCYFIEDNEEETLLRAIRYCYDNVKKLKRKAMECRDFFSYKKIAKFVIEDCV